VFEKKGLEKLFRPQMPPYGDLELRKWGGSFRMRRVQNFFFLMR
jgi:hypothetical protein